MTGKRIVLDVSEIERLAGLGLSQAEISLKLGISEDTLTRRKMDTADVAEAIKRGQVSAAEVVSSKLFELCKRGNLGAIIWYEKTRRGLSDRLNVSGDIDQRIESELAKLAAARQVEVSREATARE